MVKERTICGFLALPGVGWEPRGLPVVGSVSGVTKGAGVVFFLGTLGGVFKGVLAPSGEMLSLSRVVALCQLEERRCIPRLRETHPGRPRTNGPPQQRKRAVLPETILQDLVG